jgi:hypothetical protein
MVSSTRALSAHRRNRRFGGTRGGRGTTSQQAPAHTPARPACRCRRTLCARDRRHDGPAPRRTGRRRHVHAGHGAVHGGSRRAGAAADRAAAGPGVAHDSAQAPIGDPLRRWPQATIGLRGRQAPRRSDSRRARQAAIVRCGGKRWCDGEGSAAGHPPRSDRGTAEPTCLAGARDHGQASGPAGRYTVSAPVDRYTVSAPVDRFAEADGDQAPEAPPAAGRAERTPAARAVPDAAHCGHRASTRRSRRAPGPAAVVRPVELRRERTVYAQDGQRPRKMT